MGLTYITEHIVTYHKHAHKPVKFECRNDTRIFLHLHGQCCAAFGVNEVSTNFDKAVNPQADPSTVTSPNTVSGEYPAMLAAEWLSVMFSMFAVVKSLSIH